MRSFHCVGMMRIFGSPMARSIFSVSSSHGPERDDEFIHQRQNGADGRDERIAEFLAVAQKGEPADFHGPQFQTSGGKFQG